MTESHSAAGHGSELISEEILQILLDKSAQDSAAMKARIEEILNRDKPKCNKCGVLILSPSRWNNIQAKIHWGYESTGKDTDCDIWNLCAKCTQEFRTQYFPVCSMCYRSIPDVMAKLDYLNPHHTYYGDYPAALARVCSMDHCGLEYAEIEGRIICEECYEDFLGSFQIPLQAGSYGIWDGEHLPGEGFQRHNRIQEALKHRASSEDSISTHYSAWLDWNELLQVRQGDKKHEKIIHLSYTDDSQEFLDSMLEKHPDWQRKVYAQTGDNQFYSLPISWLQELASKAEQQLDPTKLRVTNSGQTLHFGEFQLATKVVIEDGAQFKNCRD